jgi:hypothetical protein
MVIIGVVPSAPSNVGVVHYGIYATLIAAAAVLNVNVSEIMKHSFAVASIYLHLSYFLPEVFIGGIFTWMREILSLPIIDSYLFM